MKDLPGKNDIIQILKKIKDPETEMSIFDLGLIKNIDYKEKDKTLIINIALRSHMPSCKTCQFISLKIIDTITSNLEKEFLKYPAIEKIEFVDK
jgi:metal-sulfur cluster biosynthetic enzyme